jgi:hypothetical protein
VTAVTTTTVRICQCGDPEDSDEHRTTNGVFGHNFCAETPTQALHREARHWLADNEWPDVDEDDFLDPTLYNDPQIRAAVGRHYDGGWVAFLAANAADDLTNTARAWLEDHPHTGVDPDGDPAVIWAGVRDRFPGGWVAFAAYYADLCVCGCLSGSDEHGPDGHPFQARETRQEIPA